MTDVLVDSNVLLDVATRDARWGEWSSQALEAAADAAALVINPLIYAEVSIGFATIEELNGAVPAAVFRREALPYEAAFLAGKAFLDYRRRVGPVTQTHSSSFAVPRASAGSRRGGTGDPGTGGVVHRASRGWPRTGTTRHCFGL